MSLNEYAKSNGDGTERGDLFAAPKERRLDPELKPLLEKLLQSLSPREREVIALRFGLKTGNPLTLDEVAREYKITRERVRQIEARAMGKLQHPSRKQALEDHNPHIDDD